MTNLLLVLSKYPYTTEIPNLVLDIGLKAKAKGYGKEYAYSAIPLAETQAEAGNSPSITFVSSGVHSVVKGQKISYGDAAVWQKRKL